MARSRNKSKVTTSSEKTHEERRREPRVSVSQPGLIKTKVGAMAAADLLDVSRSGIRVASPCAVPPDAQIEILLENTRFIGDVRYCVRCDENQFLIGVGNARSNTIARRIYDPAPARLKD